MFHITRKDRLTSQHINVALVYREMLGLADAMAYLERELIPKEIAERVLLTDRRRNAQHAAPLRAFPSAPLLGCRRKNHIHDAIVEQP